MELQQYSSSSLARSKNKTGITNTLRIFKSTVFSVLRNLILRFGLVHCKPVALELHTSTKLQGPGPNKVVILQLKKFGKFISTAN